jgi:hypothetical protein
MTLSSGNSIRGGFQTRGRCFGAGSRTWRPSLFFFVEWNDFSKRGTTCEEALFAL